ncbi:MAG: DNA repair protein RecN [Clostridia bacterium]|nr:DNA repair protein RecN [Clostridia bacterium]
MIQSLTIRNIVLIEELTIRFQPGMQALSGETGAGKSIVVDAVNLILGGRADRSLIRTGEDKASVEAIFDATGNPEAQAVLRREGIDAEDGLVLYREMTASGKNVCRVCGVMVSAGLLRELGTLLMDIHGQHEHQFLMDEEMQLRFLDRMGSAEHRTLMRKTEEACEAFLGVHRQYARMKRENDQKQRRLQELEADLKELHQARLKPGEEETLQQEGARLRNAEKIVSALRGAREALSYGENEASSLEKIKAAAGTLGSLGKYGETMKSLASRCENAYYELEEVAFEISAAMDSFDHDPGKLEKTEERLDLIRRLERKYGATLDEVISEQQKMEAEYEQLCSLEDRLAETAAEHKRLLAAYRGAARELSESRKAVARRFEQDMMAQLKDLGMEKTVFSVAFSEPEGERKPMPRPMGDDQTSFLISPNPGEPLKPLARIASGGELSRMMLALKALEAEGSGVDCMVFDEIDTGISGRMAQVVAEKMHAIARKRQVICVTHLPQIAAAADYEFLVEKSVENGRTRTRVTLLDREGRIQEVARMISGAEGSGSEAKAYARKMLEAGETVAAARHESE